MEGRENPASKLNLWKIAFVGRAGDFFSMEDRWLKKAQKQGEVGEQQCLGARR